VRDPSFLVEMKQVITDTISPKLIRSLWAIVLFYFRNLYAVLAVSAVFDSRQLLLFRLSAFVVFFGCLYLLSITRPIKLNIYMYIHV